MEYELAVLSKLVSFNTDSTTKSFYTECAQYIAEECEKLGLKVDVLDAKGLAEDGKPRPNVIAELPGKDRGKRILLATHYDVVPAGPGWTKDPFKLTLEGGRAYGRGAGDDKSAIAAVLGAFKKIADEGMEPRNTLVLLATCDEEVGGKLGLGYVLEKGVSGDAAVVIDAGPEYVAIGASGIIWGKIVVRGKQAHAAYPFLGKNAIVDAARLVLALEDYRKMIEQRESKYKASPGSPKEKVWPRFNITIIRAGVKENVIPGECELFFDRRMIPDEDAEEASEELERFVYNKAKELGIHAEYKEMRKGGQYATDPEHPFVKTFLEIASRVYGQKLSTGVMLGGNDGHYFASKGIPVISFGCVRIDCNFHGKDEFVYVDDVFKMRDIVVELGAAEF